MKLISIGDIHLKPWIIDSLKIAAMEHDVNIVVFLGDIVDEWGKTGFKHLYMNTIDKIIEFSRWFTGLTYFCMGNHEFSYLYQRYTDAYSYDFDKEIADKIREMMTEPKINSSICHRVENFLFSHAGIHDRFVTKYTEFIDVKEKSIDSIIDIVNDLGEIPLSASDSPVWLRITHCPQRKMIGKDEGMIHVVGHTPVKRITYLEDQNVILTDTFSIDPLTGRPMGSEEFLLIDLETGNLEPIKAKKEPTR